MQIFGIITELLRSYYVLIIILGWVGWLGFGAWLVCVGLCVGRGQAPKPSLAGGFCGWSFFLWLFVLARVLEEVKEKSPTQEGRFADEVFFFGSLCWLVCWKRSKKKAHPLRVGHPKSSKIPKIPIAINDIGSSNDSRNTSREQPHNQTEKKIIQLYVNVNDC